MNEWEADKNISYYTNNDRNRPHTHSPNNQLIHALNEVHPPLHRCFILTALSIFWLPFSLSFIDSANQQQSKELTRSDFNWTTTTTDEYDMIPLFSCELVQHVLIYVCLSVFMEIVGEKSRHTLQEHMHLITSPLQVIWGKEDQVSISQRCSKSCESNYTIFCLYKIYAKSNMWIITIFVMSSFSGAGCVGGGCAADSGAERSGGTVGQLWSLCVVGAAEESCQAHHGLCVCTVSERRQC